MIIDSNPMVDNDKVKEACRGAGLTNKALGDLLGVSTGTIKYRWRFGNWTVRESYIICMMTGLDMRVFYAHPERLGLKTADVFNGRR